MKNNTSLLLSALGGIVLGSAATCLLHKGLKTHKIDAKSIHKKVLDELDQLRNFVAAQHSGEICSGGDPTCNSAKE